MILRPRATNRGGPKSNAVHAACRAARMQRRGSCRGLPGSVLLAVLVALAACGNPTSDITWTGVEARIQEAFPDVPSVDPATLSRMMQDPTRSLLLLDVRQADEFAVSHLQDAVRAASPDHAEELLRAAPAGAAVVAYCSVGFRSARLVAALRERGLADVHNLSGSIFRWANEDRPLFRGDTAVRGVHPFNETWGVLLQADRRAYAP